MSGRRRASDVFVECLEAEGVRYVFGIPGEETLDLNQSLANSSVTFIPVRHEQGGAYMADMYGRLTGRAGVCLGTLGPGAMNLVTPIGDAFLDRAPVVALTGQAALERMHKESHQFIDLVGLFRPITKWNARVTSPDIIPEVVRKAFKVAESEKPGATMLELPEDVMAAETDEVDPLRRRRPVSPEPAARELLKAADLIRSAISPVVLAGNGVVRARAAPALREFCRATGIAVAETFMGKGLVDAYDAHALGTVGLHDARLRDGRLRGRRRGHRRSATTSSSTRRRTGIRARTRRSSSSIPSRRRSTSSSSPRSSSSATSTTCSPGWPRSAATSRTPAARTGCARSSSAACRRPARTTGSRCSRRARCGRSARRSGARTS